MPDMNERRFGRDSIAISEMGLGCWQIGGNWGQVEESVAQSILTEAVETGVTFLDTADVYGNGRSEEIIGRFLRNAASRSELFVATKVGRGPMYPNGYTEAGVRSAIEGSLTRLGVDALDLVQTHCIPEEAMRSGEVYGWLQTLVDEGKIKRVGASVETVDEANWLIDNLDCLYSLQIIFNLYRQKPIDTVFANAQARQVGIIARVPLASGALSGKFTKETVFGEDDHRNFNRDGAMFNVGETFAGVPFEQAVAFADEIRSLTPDGWSVADLALRWILDFEAVSVVIPGATRVEQARGNARVSELPPLSADIHERLRALYREKIESSVRGRY